MLKEIKNLKEFEENLAQNKFTVVGFYSSTCVECRKLFPLFLSGSENYPSVSFLRVNFSELSNKEIIKERKIFSPTLLFFKEGKEYKRFAVEVVPFSEIKSEFLEFLESSK